MNPNRFLNKSFFHFTFGFIAIVLLALVVFGVTNKFLSDHEVYGDYDYEEQAEASTSPDGR